jgi:hypothetical protein
LPLLSSGEGTQSASTYPFSAKEPREKHVSTRSRRVDTRIPRLTGSAWQCTEILQENNQKK